MQCNMLSLHFQGAGMRQGSVGRSYPHFETTILNPDQKYLLTNINVILLFDNNNFLVEWGKSVQGGGMCFLDTCGTRRRPRKSLTLR